MVSLSLLVYIETLYILGAMKSIELLNIMTVIIIESGILLSGK